MPIVPASLFPIVAFLVVNVATAQCTDVWQSIGGLNGAVETSIQWDPDGAGPASPVLVVGGSFTTAAGIAANHIAAWNPGTGLWSALGSGTNGTVSSLAALQNGELVAAGNFTAAGGVSVSGIARWNGTSWSSLGAGFLTPPADLAVAPNGDLVAVGAFSPVSASPSLNVAVWDGASWTLSSAGQSPYAPPAVAALADGTFVVAMLNGLVRGSGSNWGGFGTGSATSIREILELPNGDVIVAGSFLQVGGVPASGIARWDGAAWQALGSGIVGIFLPIVDAVAVLPDGDLVVGGLFSSAGGTPAANIARWNGLAWSAFGTGTNANVSALSFLDDGRLAVGGDFTSAGGLAGNRIALLGTTCPASAAPAGTGCPSSGGGNVLAAVGLPWADGVFRAVATGLPASALGVAVTGLSAVAPGFPLQSVFPIAQPGCDLYVAPDILQAVVAGSGTAQTGLFLPDTPPIAGLVFFHQVVVIELDAFGGWVAMTATNALQLTAGSF